MTVNDDAETGLAEALASLNAWRAQRGIGPLRLDAEEGDAMPSQRGYEPDFERGLFGKLFRRTPKVPKLTVDDDGRTLRLGGQFAGSLPGNGTVGNDEHVRQLFQVALGRDIDPQERLENVYAEYRERRALEARRRAEQRRVESGLLTAAEFDGTYGHPVDVQHWTDGHYVSVHEDHGVVVWRDHEHGTTGARSIEVMAADLDGGEARELAEALEQVAGDAEDGAAVRTYPVEEFEVAADVDGTITVARVGDEDSGYSLDPDQARNFAAALTNMAAAADDLDGDTPDLPDDLDAQATAWLGPDIPNLSEEEQTAQWVADAGGAIVNGWLNDGHLPDLRYQLGRDAAPIVLYRVLRDMRENGESAHGIRGNTDALAQKVWAAMHEVLADLNAGVPVSSMRAHVVEFRRMLDGEFTRADEDYSPRAAAAAALMVETLAGESLTSYQRDVLAEFTRAHIPGRMPRHFTLPHTPKVGTDRNGSKFWYWGDSGYRMKNPASEMRAALGSASPAERRQIEAALGQVSREPYRPEANRGDEAKGPQTTSASGGAVDVVAMRYGNDPAYRGAAGKRRLLRDAPVADLELFLDDEGIRERLGLDADDVHAELSARKGRRLTDAATLDRPPRWRTGQGPSAVDDRDYEDRRGKGKVQDRPRRGGKRFTDAARAPEPRPEGGDKARKSVAAASVAALNSEMGKLRDEQAEPDWGVVQKILGHKTDLTDRQLTERANDEDFDPDTWNGNRDVVVGLADGSLLRYRSDHARWDVLRDGRPAPAVKSLRQVDLDSLESRDGVQGVVAYARDPNGNAVRITSEDDHFLLERQQKDGSWDMETEASEPGELFTGDDADLLDAVWYEPNSDGSPPDGLGAQQAPVPLREMATGVAGVTLSQSSPGDTSVDVDFAGARIGRVWRDSSGNWHAYLPGTGRDGREKDVPDPYHTIRFRSDAVRALVDAHFEREMQRRDRESPADFHARLGALLEQRRAAETHEPHPMNTPDMAEAGLDLPPAVVREARARLKWMAPKDVAGTVRGASHYPENSRYADAIEEYAFRLSELPNPDKRPEQEPEPPKPRRPRPSASRRPSDVQGAERRTLATDVAKRYEVARNSGQSHTAAVDDIASSLSYETERGRDFTLAGARTLVRDLLRENGVDTSARRPAKAAKATPAKAAPHPELGEPLRRRTPMPGDIVVDDATGARGTVPRRGLIQWDGGKLERVAQPGKPVADGGFTLYAGGATPAKATPRAAFDADDVWRRVNAAKDRDEGRAALQGLTAPQLRAVAGNGSRVPLTGATTRDEIVRRIVEFTVGDRLGREALRKSMPGDESFEAAEATKAKATPRGAAVDASATAEAKSAPARFNPRTYVDDRKAETTQVAEALGDGWTINESGTSLTGPNGTYVAIVNGDVSRRVGGKVQRKRIPEDATPRAIADLARAMDGGGGARKATPAKAATGIEPDTPATRERVAEALKGFGLIGHNNPDDPTTPEALREAASAEGSAYRADRARALADFVDRYQSSDEYKAARRAAQLGLADDRAAQWARSDNGDRIDAAGEVRRLNTGDPEVLRARASEIRARAQEGRSFDTVGLSADESARLLAEGRAEERQAQARRTADLLAELADELEKLVPAASSGERGLDAAGVRAVLDAFTRGAKPYGNVTYADPGMRADGKARYPIDTADHARSAWAYINQPGNAAEYTPEQLRQVKARIAAACKKFGIEVSAEHREGAFRG